MGTSLVVNDKVVQPCCSATNVSQTFKVHTNWSPEDLPLGCQQSKCHLNSDSKLAQTEIVGPVSGNMFQCSTEWNDDFVGWWTSIVSNQEVLVRQIVNTLSQFNTSIECPCVVGPSWTDDTKVNEAKICVNDGLDIHSTSLVMTTEAVRCVVNILWFVNAAKPTINCTNTAMECSKGTRLLIPI